MFFCCCKSSKSEKYNISFFVCDVCGVASEMTIRFDKLDIRPNCPKCHSGFRKYMLNKFGISERLLSPQREPI